MLHSIVWRKMAKIIIILFLVVDAPCTDVPVAESNGSSSTTLTGVYLDVRHIVCNEGYEAFGMNASYISYCTATHAWQPAGDCIGTHFTVIESCSE